MEKQNEKCIVVNGRTIKFEIAIKQIISFEKLFVILLREDEEMPNNISAFDYNGNQVWSINDIVQVDIPRGFDEITKISDSVLEAYCELGIVYSIEIYKKKILTKEFVR